LPQQSCTLRDLQLIGAAQRVEHYEVAAYGTAKAMAEQLGMTEAAERLGETLAEEEQADEKLTEVAEGLYGEVKTREQGEEDERAEDSAPQASRRASTKKKTATKKR
jgi:ferritin-like metal-binding protein YciE